MAQSAKSNVSEMSTDVSKQMSVLREDVSKLTELVAEYGKAQGQYAKQEAANKANAIADAGVDAAKAAQAKAQDTFNTAEDAVRKNPTAAVGIAAGLGFLVGMLAARR